MSAGTSPCLAYPLVGSDWGNARAMVVIFDSAPHSTAHSSLTGDPAPLHSAGASLSCLKVLAAFGTAVIQK